MKKFTEFVPEGWVPTFHNEPPKNTEKDEVDRFLAEAVEPDLLDIIGNKLNAAVDQDKGYDKNVRYIAQRVGEMTDEEARSILKAFYTVHFDDGNLSSEYKDHITELAKGYPGMGGDPPGPRDPEIPYDDDKDEAPEDYSLEVRFQASLVKYWSPYVEVRAVTDAYDDPNEPCETIRSYFVGFIWMVIGAGVNQFFAFRFPSISLPSNILQLLSYPSGKLLEFILPDWGFTFRGHRISLNPGPWSRKEQMFATFFISGGGTPYITTANIPVQLLPMFYHETWATFGYQTILTLSNQLIGMGLTGMLRRFAIYPAKAMWPMSMPTIALNRALLQPKRKERINGWTISAYLFFFASFCFMFIYFWFPNYIFQALSTFNWMTWIAPNNKNLAFITGSQNMGINPFPTFDWNVITGGAGDPLVVPWSTLLNVYFGVWIGTFAIIGVFFNNVRNTAYLAMNQPGIYDNTGSSYNVSLILNSAGRFVEEKYQAYSPPFWTAGSLVSYGAFFTVYTLGISYCLLQYRRDIWSAMKDLARGVQFWRKDEFRNTHHDNTFVRSMNNYKDAPEWWFIALLLVSFGLAVATVEHWPTNTPVWGIVFVLGLNYVFLIPITMISAYTGSTWSMNVLVEIIIGVALKGRPQALNILKAYGVMIDSEASGMASVWKIGLYTYVPSRAVFRSQIISAVLASFTCLGVLQYQLHLQGICTPAQRFTTKFTCPGLQQFFSASVLFGAIGTERFMTHLYPFLKWCFLLGAALGPFFWFIQTGGPEMLAKWKPQYARKCVQWSRRANLFNPVNACVGIISFAPGNLCYFTGAIYVGALWRFWVRRRYIKWWAKYTYVLSAGFGCGIALSGIIMFFALSYRTGTTKAPEIDWWGNNAPATGFDGQAGPRLDIPAVGYFGPPAPFP
ncbi:YALI0A03949p [Yarrowia lipolytica CLIB122]|jgi:OPT family small oligopeptide transporter|uniref:YALI0A03949p n=2 Tax=Yarrowia lipolytica TaxID=4952 RepID=Q6CHW8_YARLI|nr:YALI0A03949p [Yarrowia lipolytica CLIB122]AOW00236.1 hypothetical protein YALI1_A04261g [Yarrowia lipolytica]KAJ8051352.1 OPT oligopeptide transporter protein-domain-containing protein [Yarrowia lipolytica]QNP95075.1 Oligopeptide transporter 2 [Yarrowia lipolytica]CAG83666.1 YALI0A03949p [Yarrowia lipolytica CLIB122]SEI36219.1 YALIA101S10e03686g1_1 [Yarrowia lipolytica]|eukprot:XP_499743.1 YALI0A03949p [Yarrowia lipolytica CLIB122]